VILDGLAAHSRIASLIQAAREQDVPIEYANKGGLASIVAALRTIDRRRSL
jgi:hypothetical protein